MGAAKHSRSSHKLHIRSSIKVRRSTNLAAMNDVHGQAHHHHPGISGISLYLPEPQVNLRQWCEWTGHRWDKVSKVVGESFRLPAPYDNVYTMAANAALRLVRQYHIDPRRVGMLALGTESSTDNAAGAVIVRGMLDRALDELGLPRLSRSCEVPEFKHACLGGIYALKSALRYVSCDGSDRVAIVVCGDIAEYERGSTGEATQGAGAVAMLVERTPQLLSVDLGRCGSASDYRGPDFRKPIARYFTPGYATNVERLHDFPVFSGRYSTYAYLDETAHAFEMMVDKHDGDALSLLQRAGGLFFHRPYAHMPVQALSLLWVRALAAAGGDGKEQAPLEALCASAGYTPAALRVELATAPDLYAGLLEAEAAGEPRDPSPIATAVSSAARRSAPFKALVNAKCQLGRDTTRHFGNLYTAALPGWLAAAFEDAFKRNMVLEGQPLYAIGYGSGDAAEALVLRAAPRWRDAAARIDLDAALAGARTLTQQEYETLHDSGRLPSATAPASGCFSIARVGQRHEAGFQDLGVEYYAFAATPTAARPR